MDPNEKPGGKPEDEIDDGVAGQEVGDDFVDDNERDEAAAAQAAGDDSNKQQSREDILEDVRRAMQEAGGEEPADDKDKGGDAGKKPAEGDAPAEGDGKDKAGDGKPPATPAEDAEAKAAAEKAETERKAAVDKEFAELQKAGKNKTRDRFHELNRQVAESNAANELLTKTLTELKITGEDGKPLALPEAAKVLTERVRAHEEFEDAIFSTGISADDFKNVAAYKHAINSSDPLLWQQARDFLAKELAWLETDLMGARPREGEAFSAHEDLKTKVEKGELSTADANEIAQYRNVQAASTRAREAATKTAETTTAAQTAAEACASYGQELSAADAQQFAAKWPVLKPKLAEIQKNFPPDQWRDRMELEYGRIAYTPAQPQQQQPGNGQRRLKPGQLPRGGARRPAADHGTIDRSHEGETPFEAMRRGMMEAGGGEG